MATPKMGDIVTGKLLFGGSKLHTGKVIEEDARISRDAVIVELENKKIHVMLTMTITELIKAEPKKEKGV